MSKVVSAVAIHALREALTSIYWYKKDLNFFLKNCISDKTIITRIDWSNYKHQIVADLVDILCSDQDKYLGDIRRLFHEVSKMDSFQHLEHVEDSRNKIRKAKTSVAELKRIVDTHDAATEASQFSKERRKKEAERVKHNLAIKDKLAKIKVEYFSLFGSDSPQKRGFKLESILYDLFELFDLDPKASFRNTGEQIDGAFSLEGTDYLFEGKWQQQPSGCADLDSFAAKISRKLDNTLGLFLSINGFSVDGVKAHAAGRSVTILMTGADLMAVLEERIDFVQLIRRKKRHAAQTGDILLEFKDF